jgi:hypothetical protein
MIEVVREFVVKEDFCGQFELAYGPGGAWSKLFSDCPGFRGTTVMRDTKAPRRYMTIDLWDSETQWEQALVDKKAKYAEVEAAFDEWIESRKALGTFGVLAQATVRPRGRPGQRRVRGSRRRTH